MYNGIIAFIGRESWVRENTVHQGSSTQRHQSLCGDARMDNLPETCLQAGSQARARDTILGKRRKYRLFVRSPVVSTESAGKGTLMSSCARLR